MAGVMVNITLTGKGNMHWIQDPANNSWPIIETKNLHYAPTTARLFLASMLIARCLCWREQSDQHRAFLAWLLQSVQCRVTFFFVSNFKLVHVRNTHTVFLCVFHFSSDLIKNVYNLHILYLLLSKLMGRVATQLSKD